MNSKSIYKFISAVVLAAVLLLGTAGRAFGQSAPSPQPGQNPQPAPEVRGPVPWVSNITGDPKSLQIRQPDSDWFEGVVNTPLGEGDQLFQDAGGRSEVYIDRGTWIRLDENTGIRLDSLKENEISAVVTRGSAEAQNGSDVPLYLDVPGQTVIVDRGGRARVNVNDNGQTEIAVKRGRVRAHGPTGDVRIEAGQTLVTDANGKIVRLDRGVKGSRFDNYSDNRDSSFVATLNPPVSDMYDVPEPVAADFAGNGVWIDDPQYGTVWRPNVPGDWAPYRDGRWVFRPGWGWTWVSYEPWGWYPYHYGRWIYVGSSWAWAPVYVRNAYWSPALVFWVDGPDYIAWQPWPYGVVYGAYFGPAWYGYVYPYAITCVHYDDFGRGYYGRYNRPWNESYRGHAEYRGWDQRSFSNRDMNQYRSPRADGFTPRSRTPGDERLYANRGDSRNGQSQRVSYGANDRNQVRQNAGRNGIGDVRPSTGDRGTNRQRDAKRDGGNFTYGAPDRPRPGTSTGRQGQDNRNNRPNTDRPRPNGQGANSYSNRTTDRPTQQGRTHDYNSSTRPRPDNGSSGSYQPSQPADRPTPNGNTHRTSRPQPSRDAGTDNSGSGSSGGSYQPPADSSGSGSSGGGYQPPADSGNSGGSSGGSSGGYRPSPGGGSSGSYGGSSGGSSSGSRGSSGSRSSGSRPRHQ